MKIKSIVSCIFCFLLSTFALLGGIGGGGIVIPGGGGGGGSITNLPVTTNVLIGNGTGGAADSGIPLASLLTNGASASFGTVTIGTTVITNMYGNLANSTNFSVANLSIGATSPSNNWVGTFTGNGSGLTNVPSTAITGTMVTQFPTNTVVGYLQIALKYGTTNLFIPLCYTNQ